MLLFIKRNIALTAVVIGSLFVVSCASISSPTGGEPDFDPPKVVNITPAPGSTNVKSNKINIYFDENVILKDPSEKIIVTPPQQKMPIIRAVNKKVTVELRDTLLPNSTYTVDFTDAIQDNNENNPLENFSFSFSTGDVVDSLSISGRVLMADNLEPVKGIYVGLHANLADSAFTTQKFLRISRTSETGEFTIRGVAPGKYRLYALDDISRKYLYNNPSQMIAFYDSIIKPYSVRDEHMDSLFFDKEKTKLDTVVRHEFSRFLPDNIVLRSFKSAFKRKYLQKHERQTDKLALYFGAPTDMPEVKVLNFDEKKDWAVVEHNATNDTIFYWLKDPRLIQTDTLKLQVSYLKTDTLNRDLMATDTLNFILKALRTQEKKDNKKKKNDEENAKKIDFLNVKSNVSSMWDTYNVLNVEFSEPIKDSLNGKVKLQQKVDSIYKDVNVVFMPDTLNPRKYIIPHNWKYGEEYRLQIDSASIHGLYGNWNDKFSQDFKVKKEEEYSKLAIHVSGIPDSIPAFIELLDKSDKPVRKADVIDGVAIIIDLIPGQYYARIILDSNGNGKWDTGNYYTGTQPEMVCYYNNYFELKAFFEKEEFWQVDVNNLANQKPLEITKNKPQDKEARLKKIEERDAKVRDREKQQRARQNGRNNNQPLGAYPQSNDSY